MRPHPKGNGGRAGPSTQQVQARSTLEPWSGLVGDSYFVYEYPNPTPDSGTSPIPTQTRGLRANPWEPPSTESTCEGGSTAATPLLSDDESPSGDKNGVRFPWAALFNVVQ